MARLILSSLRIFVLPIFILVILFSSFQNTGPAITEYVQTDRYIEQVGVREFNQSTFVDLTKYHPDFDQVPWQRVAIPDVIPLPMVGNTPEKTHVSRVWYRLRYTVPSTSSTDEILALYGNRIMGGAYTVWMNGKLISANINNWRMQWNVPLLTTLPIRSGRPGQTLEIYLAVPYSTSQGYAVGSLSVGPDSAIHERYDTRVFWQSDMPRAALLVSLILGLMSFQFWLSRRGETEHLLLALTAIAWFISNLQYFFDFSNNVVALKWYGVLVDAAISWAVVLSYIFALRFSVWKFPKVEWACIVYASLVTIFTLPVWNWGVNGLLLQHGFDLTCGILLGIFIIWLALHREASIEFRALVAAIWSIVLFGTHDLLWVTSQVAPDRYHLLPYCTVPLFGAFIFAMNRRYIRSLQQAEELNITLDQRVKAREEELEKQHAQIQLLEREQARQDERQRLARDIHDCIGSRLITSQIEVNNGHLSVSEIGEILQACIDDLRLVIESREFSAHDLPALLCTVRYRLQKSMVDAGINVELEMAPDLPPLPWLDPSSALNIMRILLEALTNVHKHAKATLVIITAKYETADDAIPCICLGVTDNGQGFLPHSHPSGRGMKNMQHRAIQVGGLIQFDSHINIGTSVKIYLPLGQRSPSKSDT